MFWNKNKAKGDKDQIIEKISPKEAINLIEKNENNPDFKILDVRTLKEFNDGNIQNAELLIYRSDEYENRLESMDKSKIYFIYCRSGRRSGKTLKKMKDLGYREVYDLSGGIKQWIKEDLPIMQK